MDFTISKPNLNSALRQMLQGQKTGSNETVDLTITQNTLTVVITGRSIELPVETGEIGSASLPASVLQGVKRVLRTYQEDSFRIRVFPGKLKLQGYTITEPRITLRNVGKRIIDIPADALDLDLLSIPLLFTREEIEESALSAKVLDAQHRLSLSMESATHSLNAVGVTHQEIRDIVTTKIRTHATGLGNNILFNHGNDT
jgi:hypothetical protein